MARYTADFRYYDLTTETWVVEDVKGMMTPDAAIRIGLMAAIHNITVSIVKITLPRRR